MRERLVASLADVRARIAAAATAAGRDASEVTLIAVTKGHGLDVIAAVLELGVEDLGENRVQELVPKARALPQARWHMIGSLQRNKVREVTGRVAAIHSVDSTRLATEIDARARAAGVVQPILVQVNISGESGKHGVEPRDALAVAEQVAGFEGLRLGGLMGMAAEGDPEQARASFAMLRDLRDRLVERVPGASALSMGMTSDFEIAIAEGATHVRVGTAIFGPRPSP